MKFCMISNLSRNSLQCFFDNSTRERRHFCSSFFYYFVVGTNIPQSFSPPLPHIFPAVSGKNNCVVWIWINNNILCDFTPLRAYLFISIALWPQMFNFIKLPHSFCDSLSPPPTSDSYILFSCISLYVCVCRVANILFILSSFFVFPSLFSFLEFFGHRCVASFLHVGLGAAFTEYKLEQSKNVLRSCGLVLFIYIYLWSKTNFYFTAFCLFSRVVFQSVKLCCISKVIFLLYNSKISHKNFLRKNDSCFFLSFSCFYLFAFFFQKQTTYIFFI